MATPNPKRRLVSSTTNSRGSSDTCSSRGVEEKGEDDDDRDEFTSREIHQLRMGVAEFGEDWKRILIEYFEGGFGERREGHLKRQWRRLVCDSNGTPFKSRWPTADAETATTTTPRANTNQVSAEIMELQHQRNASIIGSNEVLSVSSSSSSAKTIAVVTALPGSSPEVPLSTYARRRRRGARARPINTIPFAPLSAPPSSTPLVDTRVMSSTGTFLVSPRLSEVSEEKSVHEGMEEEEKTIDDGEGNGLEDDADDTNPFYDAYQVGLVAGTPTILYHFPSAWGTMMIGGGGEKTPKSFPRTGPRSHKARLGLMSSSSSMVKGSASVAASSS